MREEDSEEGKELVLEADEGLEAAAVDDEEGALEVLGLDDVVALLEEFG